jgi:cell wall-associated NlpC family hydrolase
MHEEFRMYEDLLGVPFQNRGRDPKIGLDCYGLAIEIFRRHGIQLPEFWIHCLDFSTIEKTIGEQKARWIRVGIDVIPSIAVIRLRSKHYNHVLINIGRGRFIHTRRSVGVQIERFDDLYWRKRYDGFYIPKEGQA